MVIIPKGKKEIAARPKREELVNIPSAEADHKTRKMGGRGRKPSKLVIYIYTKYTYIFLYLFI